MKPFLFLALLMGVIYAQLASAIHTDDEEDGTGEEAAEEEYQDQEEEGEEEEEEIDEEESPLEEEIQLPNLICVLFGTNACNVSCSTVANIYGIDFISQCDDLQTCRCSYPEESSLDNLWGRKFDSKSVLPQIKRNPELSQQVLEILKYSMNSSEGTKQELEDVLSDDQLSKIRIKAAAHCNKIPQPDGNFDREATKNIVNKNLIPLIKNDFPKGIDYKKSLNEALENATEEYQSQHLIKQVRRTRDPALINIVDEYLKSHQMRDETPAEESSQDITEFIDAHIINELIKATRTAPKPKPKSKPKLSPTPAKSTPPRPKQPPSNPGPSPLSNQNPDFTLPDKTINKRVIDGFQTRIDKTWPGTNYQVRFKRESPKGDTELWWSKGNNHIYLHKHADGSVDQNWHLGGKVNVGLYRDVDKTQIQSWDFGQTRLEVMKSPNAQAYREWEYNNRDEGSYHKYRQIIESWCKVNDFFVGAESCVIF